MDADAQQQRVQDIVKRATNERQQQLDPELLREIKRHCKSNDESVHTVFGAVAVAIRSRHSQQRLLGLEIADVLFTRSKLFRGLLAPQLTTFLTKTVGFRNEDPLPPPVARAEVLKHRALQALEEWNAKFGGLYHQVAIGYAYLKDTLNIEFPDVAARTASRQAEEQQAVLVAYRQIGTEFSGALLDMDNSLTQLEEALAVAEAPMRIAAAAVEEDAAMGWADALPADKASRDGNGTDADGLQGYGAEEPAPHGGRLEADVAADPAVGEAIAGCARLLTARYLPMLHNWLEIFSKVPDSSVSPAERDARIHDAIQRRRDMTRALAAADAARVQVPGLAAALDAASVARNPDASSTQEAAGPSEERRASHTPRDHRRHSSGSRRALRRSDSPTAEEDAELVAIAERHAALEHAAAPASSWALDGRFAGKSAVAQSPAQRLAAEAAASKAQPPGRAPTARPGAAASAHPGTDAASASKQLERSGAAGAHEAGIEEKQAKGDARGGKPAGALPDVIKRRLLQSAPEVAAGGHLHYWDSGSAPTTANAGMEISNHWGAVDKDTEVILSQLDGMAVNHIAQYYTPQPRAKDVPASSSARGKDLPATSYVTSAHATSAVMPTPSLDSTVWGADPGPLNPDSAAAPSAKAQGPFITHIGPSKSARLGATTAPPGRKGEVDRGSSGSDSKGGPRHAVPGPMSIHAQAARSNADARMREAAAVGTLSGCQTDPLAASASTALTAGSKTAATRTISDCQTVTVAGSSGSSRLGGSRTIGTAATTAAQKQTAGRDDVMEAARNDILADARSDARETVRADVREDVASRVHQMMSVPGGVSAFNTAILAGAQTDEDVARALGGGSDAGTSTSAGGRKRKASKPPQTAAKLKQLLSAKRSSGPKHSIPGKGHTWFR